MDKKCTQCNGHGTEDGYDPCLACNGTGANPKFVAPNTCPMCKVKIDTYDEVNTDRPFCSKDILEGLQAWGAMGLPRQVQCYTGGQFIHFISPGKERPMERLVKMLEAKEAA